MFRSIILPKSIPDAILEIEVAQLVLVQNVPRIKIRVPQLKDVVQKFFLGLFLIRVSSKNESFDFLINFSYYQACFVGFALDASSIFVPYRFRGRLVAFYQTEGEEGLQVNGNEAHAAHSTVQID